MDLDCRWTTSTWSLSIRRSKSVRSRCTCRRTTELGRASPNRRVRKAATRSMVSLLTGRLEADGRLVDRFAELSQAGYRHPLSWTAGNVIDALGDSVSSTRATAISPLRPPKNSVGWRVGSLPRKNHIINYDQPVMTTVGHPLQDAYGLSRLASSYRPAFVPGPREPTVFGT